MIRYHGPEVITNVVPREGESGDKDKERNVKIQVNPEISQDDTGDTREARKQ